MPDLRIELAAGEHVYFRAGCDGNICYYQTWMMCGKGVVKGRGENAISIVEQKDRNAEDCYDCSKLKSRADLIGS